MKKQSNRCQKLLSHPVLSYRKTPLDTENREVINARHAHHIQSFQIQKTPLDTGNYMHDEAAQSTREPRGEKQEVDVITGSHSFAILSR